MQINVAVKEPNPGIVCFESNDDKPIGGDNYNVAFRWYVGE
jgi:hypothetical protein